MSKKLVLSFLAAGLFCLAPVASAQGNGPGSAPVKKPDIWADGAGFVHIECIGHLELGGCGKGVLLIANADKTKIKLQGKGMVFHLPSANMMVILGLKGKVELTGKKVKFTFVGGAVKLGVHGKGVAWLQGKGILKIAGHPAEKWPLKKVKKYKF